MLPFKGLQLRNLLVYKLYVYVNIVQLFKNKPKCTERKAAFTDC